MLELCWNFELLESIKKKRVARVSLLPDSRGHKRTMTNPTRRDSAPETTSPRMTRVCGKMTPARPLTTLSRWSRDAEEPRRHLAKVMHELATNLEQASDVSLPELSPKEKKPGNRLRSTCTLDISNHFWSCKLP